MQPREPLAIEARQAAGSLLWELLLRPRPELFAAEPERDDEPEPTDDEDDEERPDEAA